MSSKTKTKSAAKADGKATLVPKLRFPEFRNAGEWRVDSVGSLFETSSGGTPDRTKEEYWNGNIPWITTSLVSFNTITEADEFITAAGLKNSSAKVFPEKTILIAMYGQGKTRGKVAILGKQAATNQACAAILPRKDIDPSFMFLNLGSRYDEMRSLSNRGGQENLSQGLIQELQFSYPNNQAEQQKIAECLSSVDELIAAQAQKLDALKTHKKGLMQQLFPREGETQPRLRFPEFQNASDWAVLSVGRLAENLDNRRRPISSTDREAGKVPYYGASGIVDYVEGFIFDEDLLCVSEDGANLIARTYPIAFPIFGKTWVNNHAHVLKFPNLCTQKFVEVYLNSIKLDDFITGMAQPKLNKAMLDKIPIPYPDLAEQQRIADCLTSLDDTIAAQSQKLETLKIHKKGLMQQLFPCSTDVKQ